MKPENPVRIHNDKDENIFYKNLLLFSFFIGLPPTVKMYVQQIPSATHHENEKVLSNQRTVATAKLLGSEHNSWNV